MKLVKSIGIGLLSCSFAMLQAAVPQETILVTTGKTDLVLKVDTTGRLCQSYFGTSWSDAEGIEALQPGKDAYQPYDLKNFSEPAFRMVHADGNTSSLFKYVSHTQEEIKPGVTRTVVTLRDEVYPVEVKLFYETYSKENIVKAWTEISHQEKKPVVLNQFASGYLPIRRGDVWLSHLSGSWANEGFLTQEPLTPGMKVIKNKDGVRNSHTDHAEVMFSLDGRPQENTGNVIGAALCYSGNYKLRIETHDDEYHHFFAGINEENSAYSLKKDELFRTPELALTYSNEGLSGSSRNFHRWARLHKLAHGTTPRKILLNSWEGVYFDINQQGMDQMMADIASMGGELFVMDDGWFGDKYPRKNDSSSLGDWVVDKNKLPDGVKGLLSDAKKRGIKFGIWIEPEMANTTSELYEQHPDWVLKAPERDLVLGRGGTQVVLDLANPAVQDFVFGVVDNLMTSYPEIDYIKWDFNRNISDAGSALLPADRQGEFFHRFILGTYELMGRIRDAFPDMLFENCSGGGGRFDPAMLAYSQQIWASDNTDPIERLTIQFGTSMCYPASTMGAHVSACDRTDYKVKGDVALWGTFGYELDPNELSAEERGQIKKQVDEYHKYYDLIHSGDLYRLKSPYEDGYRCAWSFVAEDKSEALATVVTMRAPEVPFFILKFKGLDPDKHYLCDFDGRVYSGSNLMNAGLNLTRPTERTYSSLKIYLKAQ